MTTVNNILAQTVGWFDKARGREGTRKNFHVQVGVHFEEVSEMTQEMSTLEPELELLIAKAKQANHELAKYLKDNSESDALHIETEDELRFLDALCDQIVTAAGTAQVCGYDIVGALAEVNRSNYSKFVDGEAIFDENGKIAKGPDYSKADLRPFLTRN